MAWYSDRIYIGVIEDNNDPRRIGRCRIRVPFTYNVLPNEQLPWASPLIDPNGKSFQVPAIGKLVNVMYLNGDIYLPYFYYADKYNINLQDKLESITEEEYKNFVALLFDHRTRVYAEQEGFTIDYLINKVKIDKSSINLELKNNDGRVNIGTAKADQPAVLGDHFIMDWFLELVKILIKPTSLTGNMGAPVLKPELDVHLQKFLTNPKKFISSNVFIVDNNKVDKLERDSITSEVEHDDTIFVNPYDGPNNSEGVNIEQTTKISKESQDKILEDQKNTRYELEEASSAVSLSNELDNAKLNDLSLSTIDIPKGVDLSQLSMKDMIDTSSVDLSTDDLSKIKPNQINIKLLTALGFSALAIIGLTKIIIDKVKEVNKKTKEKKKSEKLSKKDSSVESNFNKVDKYDKPKKNRRKINNSNYSVDKRERKDILDSSLAKSTKKRTIIYKDNPNYGKYYNSF